MALFARIGFFMSLILVFSQEEGEVLWLYSHSSSVLNVSQCDEMDSAQKPQLSTGHHIYISECVYFY